LEGQDEPLSQVQEVRVAKALNKEFIEFHGDEIHGSK